MLATLFALAALAAPVCDGTDEWNTPSGDWKPAIPAGQEGTARARRYVRWRVRVQRAPREAVARYLRRRPGVSGGFRYEDDWKRGHHVLVFVTRDRARHAAALKRLFRYPSRLRVRVVPHSERKLRRIQRRVRFKDQRDVGFRVVSTYADTSAGHVVIELITRRTDHLAHFQERYGPLVTTKVVATEWYTPRCMALDGYRVTDDGLRVFWTTSSGPIFEGVEVIESEDRVRVGVVEQWPNWGVEDVGIPRRHDVRLAAPLGDRVVIDAATGRQLSPR